MNSTVGVDPSTFDEGHWHSAKVGYLKPHSLRCELCGQLLPGRYWRDEAGKAFCGQRHHQLYLSYWLPKYGDKSGQLV